MSPKFVRITTLVAAAFALLTLTGSAQSDPFVGTWHLNLAKSKYSPGPAPKATTSTYEAAGKGYKISVKTQPASGPEQAWSYTTTLDGTDSKITGNNPNADTVAAKRINATTLEIVNKKGGKVTSTQRNVVSADGKTRTVTTEGTTADGQKVSNVAVYEKH